MLKQITCPNCGHLGATAAARPRILTCSQCGHSAFIKTGQRTRSPIVIREERAAEQAALERYEAMGAEFDD
jgi:DNA-directed RNA polymerase subunit RPC12/RpoP